MKIFFIFEVFSPSCFPIFFFFFFLYQIFDLEDDNEYRVQTKRLLDDAKEAKRLRDLK